MAARAERTRSDSDWVLTRLRMEADADLADALNDDGGLNPIREWPLIWRTGLVVGIEVEELWNRTGGEREFVGHRVKAKLADRFSRVLAIGRHVRVNAFKEITTPCDSDDLREAFEKMVRSTRVFAPPER